MAIESPRSEQVVQDYKKHKLAHNALRKIQQLIQGFENERVADARMARVGIVLIVVIIALTVLYFLNMESVTLP